MSEMYLKTILSLTLIVCSLRFFNSDRIKAKIYKNLESNYSCIRRLNGTHQIGCTTEESGSVGVIYIINDDNDMDYVLKTGDNYPYVAVITPKHFNFESFNRFRISSDRISGVILLDIKEKASELDSYSPDKSCPNQYFDMYANNASYGHCAKQKWNIVDKRDNDNHNENLMFNDWPFPIFMIRNETNITYIQECFSKYGKDWPLCAIQLTASTYGAKDTVTCIRRSYMKNSPINLIKQIDFCVPLESRNIFSNLFPTSKNDSIDDNSIVMLASRMDSFSMFTDISPGADSAITSLVTLLTVAHTLYVKAIKEKIRQKSPKKNVMFAVFDGESFDYIGSSSTVFNIMAEKFPDSKAIPEMAEIRSEQLSHLIELNQLAMHSNDKKQTLWIHKNLNSNSELNKLQKIFEENAKLVNDLEIKSVSDGSPLPPSSLQSFLKHKKQLNGIVIANHMKEYTNKFYNSLYDDIHRINESVTKLSERLTNIATVVSNSIYELLTDERHMNLTANQTLVENLVQCYLINTNCSLFNTVSDSALHPNPNISYQTYVGSKSHSILNRFGLKLLSYFTGEEVSVNKTACLDKLKWDRRYDYWWFSNLGVNGTCIRSQTVYKSALSPAFVDYKSNGIVNSSLYSTWTQSHIREISIRIFRRPSPLQRWITLSIGIVFLIVSFLAIILIQTKAKKLFNLRENSDSEKDLSKKTVEELQE